MSESFYDLSAKATKGEFPFAELKGKVVLIVNVGPLPPRRGRAEGGAGGEQVRLHAAVRGPRKVRLRPYSALDAEAGRRLYQKYKDKEFEIIGGPLLPDERGDADERQASRRTNSRVKSRARTRKSARSASSSASSPSDPDRASQGDSYGVTFPVMAKSDVNGDKTNEVYQWLKSQKSGILGLTRIKWVRLPDRPTIDPDPIGAEL